MKKLLALVLVIGLASVSSAAYVIDVAGTAPNFTLSISTAAGDPFIGDYVLLGPETKVALTGGSNGPAADASFAVAPQPLGVFKPYVPAGMDGLYGVINGIAATAPAGVQVQGIAAHMMVPTEVILFQFNAETGETGQMFARCDLIPEPMTLSLLALGGLGLIRRRRA